ncbi:hypothetical protein [Mucilaginibacter sp. OK098]|uniref:hypothetical protein n=1 Tax=Mucilaginibacter sp. OK098 TaxID=1855297 RepID=UPI00091CBB5E|nr:hypothetical protein [Mucilaginibacter sp. OK098]SHM93142.1 hypothetical protein SAMN05216524_104160 [Mucilaginibacter sp. OK098]
MEIEDLSLLMLNAVNSGVAKAVAESGVITPFISKADAYRIYGRSNVDRWLTEHLIAPLSAPGKGSKRFLDRIKLDCVAAASNRHTYLPVADRKL